MIFALVTRGLQSHTLISIGPYLCRKPTDSPVNLNLQVLERLEAAMQLKRFSQLGGLQLDRDVRLMLSTLADLTQKPVRDKFSRIAQTAILLGLESLNEVNDVWGEEAGAITWRLTDSQARAVLAQRTDFSPQQVAALHL